MNPKDIARMITEDPDLLNEDWEELGIEDPHKDLRKIVVRDYAIHPLDFKGSQDHIPPQGNLDSLAAFDREFSLSLMERSEQEWAYALIKGFAEFSASAGSQINLKGVKIIDKDVKFHTTSGETFATNPLAHMTFTALVDEEEWLRGLQAIDKTYGDHGVDWRWDDP